ncbi:MAG: hypothetical protein ACOYK8_03975 [Alphaproteobacteria bacterium]
MPLRSKGVWLVAWVKDHILLMLGWFLIIFGIAFGALPGPGGIPIILAGAFLLVRRSVFFRRSVAYIRRRFPNFSEKMMLNKNKMPRWVRYILIRTDPKRHSNK